MRGKPTVACAAALVAFAASTAAQAARAADWLRAQSEHFTVTTDGTERREREFAAP